MVNFGAGNMRSRWSESPKFTPKEQIRENTFGITIGKGVEGLDNFNLFLQMETSASAVAAVLSDSESSSQLLNEDDIEKIKDICIKCNAPAYFLLKQGDYNTQKSGTIVKNAVNKVVRDMEIKRSITELWNEKVIEFKKGGE